MTQLLLALVMLGLMLAGCPSAPTPTAPRAGTLILSVAGVLPGARQLQYLVSGPKARVTVTGVGLAEPLSRVAPVTGETATVTLTGVPVGPNRIVTVESLDASEAPIPGGRYRTTLHVQAGSNTAVLSVASSVRGDVLAVLLAGGSELAGTLDAPALQERLDALKREQRVPHYGLLDAEAVARRLVEAGGDLAALDPLDASLVQRPGSLQVQVSGLPENLQAVIWLDDPVSPKQSGLSNGNLTIQPVKPGTWRLHGRAGVLRWGPVPVAVATGSVAAMDFARSEVLAQAMPEPRGGAASGVLSIQGKPTLVVAGGTVLDEGGNLSTDGVLAFDGTTWRSLPRMVAPVSHPAFATGGNKLYVMGGYGPGGMSDLVQVYDATLGRWSSSYPRLKYRTFLGAAACLENVLYMTSGYATNGSSYGADWSIYKLPLDGSAFEWREFGTRPSEPQLRYARYGSTVRAVGGKVYVFGGAHDDETLMHRVEVYDPVRATVRELAPMPTARHGAFSWARGNRIYVMGGVNPTGKALANVEVYDVLTDTWSVLPRLREARGHAAVGELGGRLVIAGGNDGAYVHDDVAVRSSVEALTFPEDQP